MTSRSQQPTGGFVRQNNVAARTGFVLRLLLVTMACMTPLRDGAAQDPGVTWLIFVDDLHLDFRDTGHIRKLLRSIASQLIRENDAFVLVCSGPSFGAIDRTVSRSVLDSAIARVAGNALPPAAVLPASSATDEMEYRASIALSTATELLTATPSLPKGHAAMLYISNGYPLDLLDARLAAFVSAAQRFQVPVFAMNGRSLPGAPARPLQDDAARVALLNILRLMSEPTGGIAILNESDFVDSLERGTIDRWVR